MGRGLQHIQIDTASRTAAACPVATRAGSRPAMRSPRASFLFTAPSVSQAAVNAGCSVFLPQAEQPAPTLFGFAQVADGHAPVEVRLVGLSRSFGVNRPTRLHDGQARRAKPHFIPSHSPMPSQSRPASRCEALIPEMGSSVAFERNPKLNRNA